MSSKYLIVGLGNPGKEYINTRHNIGFMLLDAFVEASSSFFVTERLGELAKCTYKGRQIFCLKPSTFMNLSGKAVKYWQQKENIPNSQILIITDDLALPCGKMKLKPKGSDGGHNGLKDIALQLNTTEYPRLRFGIDRLFSVGRQSDYVLSPFTAEEIQMIEPKKKLVIETIQLFVTLGLMRTMNLMNPQLNQ